MILRRLKLEDFRNYTKTVVSFHPGINVLFGKNGQGKTNLLESIYCLALTKSFRTSKDHLLIRNTRDFFRIEGQFQNKQGRVGEHVLAYSVRDGKRLLLNNEKINKFAEYIGYTPIVLLAPPDLAISQEGPQKRRHFIDVMLSQASKLYLYHSLEYRKALRQRNALLQSENHDPQLLNSWDEALLENGVILIEKRLEAIQQIDEQVKAHYLVLSGGSDKTKIIYNSPIKIEDASAIRASFEKQLLESRERDYRYGTTTVGPHRDDLLFLINGKPLKNVGSQGEHKTFIISLKMAEFNFLSAMNQEAPILLFDDLFGELDAGRISNMISSLVKVGQVFLTTTSPTFFGKTGDWTQNASFLEIDNGIVNYREAI